ncbi:RNA polymerase sigma factor [Sphingobacterium yanglingense]|nr:RNA polymerase sigma-70 factor [Sphingobacterium yanglingense]
MNSYTGYSEKELIILLKQNDELAFRAVFDRWHKKLYHFNLRYLHSKELAEEAVHDALVKLWTTRDNIDEEQPISSLLYTICKRLCLNRIRDAARSNAAAEALWSNYIELSNSTEDIVHAAELQKFLDQAITKLSPQQHQVFKMSRYEGLSHLQIAEKLNISKETVKKHSAEALKTLRFYLESYPGLFAAILFLH